MIVFFDGFTALPAAKVLGMPVSPTARDGSLAQRLKALCACGRANADKIEIIITTIDVAIFPLKELAALRGLVAYAANKVRIVPCAI